MESPADEAQESIKHYPTDLSIHDTSMTSETVSVATVPDFEQSSVSDQVNMVPTTRDPTVPDFEQQQVTTIQGDALHDTEPDTQSENSIIIIDDKPPTQEVELIDLTSDSNDEIPAPPAKTTDQEEGNKTHHWTEEELNKVGPDGRTFKELLKIHPRELSQEQLNFILPLFKRKWAREADRVWMLCFREKYPYHSPLFE